MIKMQNQENELYNYDDYSCSELDYSHTHGYESNILETDELEVYEW